MDWETYPLWLEIVAQLILVVVDTNVRNGVYFSENTGESTMDWETWFRCELCG